MIKNFVLIGVSALFILLGLFLPDYTREFFVVYIPLVVIILAFGELYNEATKRDQKENELAGSKTGSLNFKEYIEK